MNEISARLGVAPSVNAWRRAGGPRCQGNLSGGLGHAQLLGGRKDWGTCPKISYFQLVDVLIWLSWDGVGGRGDVLWV